jgi:phosphoglycolate phosphatase
MLEELMDELGVLPECAVMIGDTTHDLLMAQAAKVASVAVTTGAHPFEILQEAKPSVLFNSLTDMQPWLHQRIAAAA